MINHARWYFNVSCWTPTRDEWLKLTSSIALEEMERINKFVYQDDSKSSLIGCALVRKLLATATSIPTNEHVINRTSKGRPEVCKEYRSTRGDSWPSILDFNVSHSGNFCVLAGVWSNNNNLTGVRVGVDVTKIVSKKSKPELDRFLDLMSRRPFTKSEWETVEKALDDRQKCINFTRLWCLKESYIKSTGLGLSFKLDRIDFKFSDKFKYNLSTQTLRERPLDDTTVLLDGQLETDWYFYETALDDSHLVALAYHLINPTTKINDLNNERFKVIDIGSLVESLTPMREPNEFDWTHFLTRSHKT